MSAAPKHEPTCERCNHPQSEVKGMIAVHKGGMPTYLCFACIDDMKTIADHYWAEWEAPVTEMLERVARAIYDADNGIDGDQVADMLYEDDRITGTDPKMCREEVMVVCRSAARAAIAAMREPTEAMGHAAAEYANHTLGASKHIKGDGHG